eukprot:COSAG05_NODE_8526_length_695_cov_12.236577_2_plen_85_part_00
MVGGSGGGVVGDSGGGVVEAVSYDVVLYLLLGDGVLAIAGPRVVYTRFRKSPVTDLQLSDCGMMASPPLSFGMAFGRRPPREGP